MAQSTYNYILGVRVCTRSGQLERYIRKRSSCFVSNNRMHLPAISKNNVERHHQPLSTRTAYSTRTLYSTRTTGSAIKAYHHEGLKGFVYNLSDGEREELLQMLSKAAKLAQSCEKVPVPSRSQLRYVALFSGVPFIGFGILDNTIMLTAGEYIDITFGTWLGITTMAAAALGNMISDVLGITTAGFVEQTALKFGLNAPPITLEQMSLRRTKVMANLGRCIGVCIGCIIGMWPLLVFSKEKAAEKDDEDKTSSAKT